MSTHQEQEVRERSRALENATLARVPSSGSSPKPLVPRHEVFDVTRSQISEPKTTTDVPVLMHPERNHDSHLEIIRNHITTARSQGDPVIRDRAVKELQKHRGQPLVDAFFAVEDAKATAAATRLRVDALKRGGFVKSRLNEN